jgi:hypothetical protein
VTLFGRSFSPVFSTNDDKEKRTYTEFSFPSLLRAKEKLVLAQFSAYGGSFCSVFELGQVGGPLGALLGFNQKIHQLFTWNEQKIEIKALRVWSVRKHRCTF